MTGEPRLAVDTSVAVPLLVAAHEAHPLVRSWARGRDLALCGHALAETYAVLTRLPGDARLAPADAVALIDNNFETRLVLSPERARRLPRELAAGGIAGGATYDAMVALAALDAGVILVTRDARALPTYEALGVPVQVLRTHD